MKKYILILLLFVISSCGSRKVNKSNVEETKKETTETHLIDTSKTVTNTNVQVKIIDTSTTSEVEVSPIDITKPFIYNGQTLNNAILRIKKHKNNISVVSDEKSSQIKRNAIVVDSKDKVESHTSIKKKDIDKKESVLSYWWILLLIVASYIAYRKYIK